MADRSYRRGAAAAQAATGAIRRLWPGVLGVLLGLILAACGSSVTPAPTTRPPTQAPSQPARPGGSPGATLAAVAIDQTLLQYLPAAIGTLPVNYSAEATQDVVNDPTLARNAAGIAYGLAVDSTTGDLVVAAVVRLRDGVFNDSYFRDWRTTYDQAACASAGGVGGHAEATISGRTVYIGTCNGGAHTYHVYLDKAGVIISATSVGTKRFGEQLVENLRP